MDTNDIINGLNSKVNSLTELVESLQSHNGSLQEQIHKMVTDTVMLGMTAIVLRKKTRKSLLKTLFLKNVKQVKTSNFHRQ